MFKVGLMTKYENIKGVPYVVVNGQKNDDAISEFIEEVCDAYKGTNKPKVCSK